jgi:hypothetical protein
LKSTPKDSDTGHGSFRNLVNLAVNSATTDLLNVLNTVSGFGQSQNKSGAIADPAIDIGKNGAGYVDNDHNIKSALKDLLKPHE